MNPLSFLVRFFIYLFFQKSIVKHLLYPHTSIQLKRQTDGPEWSFTFLKPVGTDVAVVIPFSGAQLEHVDGHGGSDLLLRQTHAVVENLKELLRLLLLGQLVVEGVLVGRQNE